MKDSAMNCFEEIPDPTGQMHLLRKRITELKNAIIKHRSQKADDRCWMDDQELYKVLNDGDLGDNHVGDPEKMLSNCKRFIQNRCQGGKWTDYQTLELHIEALKTEVLELNGELDRWKTKQTKLNSTFNAVKGLEGIKRCLAVGNDSPLVLVLMDAGLVPEGVKAK